MVGSSILTRAKYIFTLISASVIKKWIVSVIAISIILSLLSGTGWGSLGNAFGVANIVGWLLGTGFSLLIGASLLLCTKRSRTHLLNKSIIDRTQYSYLFLSFTILALLCMTASVLIGFTVIGFNDYLRIGEFNPAFFGYIPHVLGSMIIVTILLAPISLLIVAAFDEMKLGMVVGTAIFLSLMIATGFPGFPVNRPEIAFFGPANLVSALFFILIGGFEQGYSVIAYLGVSATLLDIVPGLVLYGIVAIFSYLISRGLFILNYKRWQIHYKGWLIHEESDEDSTPHIDMAKIILELKERRRYAATFAVIVILLVPLISSFRVTSQLDEWRVVVYESPPGGESVEIGTWLYGSFSGMDPDEYVSLMVGCEGEILEGGDGTPGIRYNFQHRQMTLGDLLPINETAMDDEFGRGVAENRDAITTFGGGGSGPIHDVEYIWVLRFLEVGGQTGGMLRISLRVVIFARPSS